MICSVFTSTCSYLCCLRELFLLFYSCSLTAGRGSVSASGAIGRTGKGADGDTLIPSHVGDMDMARIREAEKVIDADEAAYGKCILDEVSYAVNAMNVSHLILPALRRHSACSP